jgi:hypothetical protein
LGRLVRSDEGDQADGLAAGLVSGLVTGLDVSGLVTTGGVDSRPGAVLLLLVEQAPTASVAARMSKASKGLMMASSFNGVPANGRPRRVT